MNINQGDLQSYTLMISLVSEAMKSESLYNADLNHVTINVLQFKICDYEDDKE
jgi:hypothetical protein